MAAGMEAMYETKIVSTHSPYLSYTPLLLNFQPASNRDHCWVTDTPLSLNRAQLSQFIVSWLFWMPSIQEKSEFFFFFFTRINIYAAHVFAYPDQRTTVWKLSECWAQHHGISHNIRLHQWRYIFGWVFSLFTWNYDIINQLYPNTK